MPTFKALAKPVKGCNKGESEAGTYVRVEGSIGEGGPFFKQDPVARTNK